MERRDGRSFTGVAGTEVPPPQPDWFGDADGVDPTAAARHFQETGRQHALEVVGVLVGDAREPSARPIDPLRVLAGTGAAEGDVADYFNGIVDSLLGVTSRLRDVERRWAVDGTAAPDAPFDHLGPEQLRVVADAVDAVTTELIGRLDVAEFAAVIDEYALHRVAPHLPPQAPRREASPRDLLVARIAMLVAGQPAVITRLDDHRASLVRELLPDVQVPASGQPPVVGEGPEDLDRQRFSYLANLVMITLAHPSRRFTPTGTPGVVELVLASNPGRELMARYAARPELVVALPPAHGGLVRHLAHAQATATTRPVRTLISASRQRTGPQVTGGLSPVATTTTVAGTHPATPASPHGAPRR